MGIAIVGSRSSTASWIAAHQLPLYQIPPTPVDERVEVEANGDGEEESVRSCYVISLTNTELSEKVRKIAKPMLRWVSDNGIPAEIGRATLQLLEGRFRFEFDTPSGPSVVEMEEELVDDLMPIQVRGNRA